MARTRIITRFMARALLALCTTAGCAGHRPPSNQQLLKASETGDLATVRRLLSEGISVDSKYPDGTTALMLAAVHGRTDIVRLLLDKGANVSTRNMRGETPLSDATQGAKAPTLKLLLDHGANPHLPCDNGGTILATAAERGNSDAVGLLLAKGFSLEDKNEALLAAAQGIPSAMMEVTNKSNQTFKGRYSSKADPSSAYSRTIRLLLQSGAQIEARDGPEDGSNTPLIVAATYGQTDAVNELLVNGANPNAADKFGNTALMSAACICAII